MSSTSNVRDTAVPDAANASPPVTEPYPSAGLSWPSDALPGPGARRLRAAACAAGGLNFVGGPWHGQTRPRPDPLPPAIDAPGCTYIPWAAHPAAAGVSGEWLEQTPTYVVDALDARQLQKRVEDCLLHRCGDDGADSARGTGR